MTSIIEKLIHTSVLRIVSAALLVATFVFLATQPATAQTLTILYNFTGGADGGYPYAGLVRDNAGNLYGTTPQGGTSLWCEAGCGTLFKVNASNTETVLHNFEGGSDGASPYYGYLLRDRAGNLYGTTSEGGSPGNGTAFELTPTGHELALAFVGGAKGGFPRAGLISDSEGNFYGTTEARGAGCAPYGCGTIFKISKTGQETVLYSFGSPPDGSSPEGELVLDSAGNLYGTTLYGGSGWGTIFKLDTSGKETVLFSFSGGNDGSLPYAGLILDRAGNLYGTTSSRGSDNAGTVFSLNPATGIETVLYSFCSQGGCGDGAVPYGGLVFDNAGNLYGTTSLGGARSLGTVFKLDPTTGSETVLYNFCFQLYCTDGASPYAGLIIDSSDNLYGTTFEGGSSFAGTVFKLSP